MKPGRVLLDVRFDGYVILVDESRNLIVRIGLGLQPSASASSRSSTEIEQHRLTGRLSICKRGVNIILPIDSHIDLLITKLDVIFRADVTRDALDASDRNINYQNRRMKG